MKDNIDIVLHNKEAWNKEVDKKNPWTIPVSKEVIEKAKQGVWNINLTPNKDVPKRWLGDIRGKKILGLACGGGQQGPILAAIGADVVIFDNSPSQLEKDLYVAERDDLLLKTVEGDMSDLSAFEDESFDFVINGISNHCVDKIQPIWAECYRVLKYDGKLITAFNNPIVYSFDRELLKNNICQLKYKIPYSDITGLSEDEKKFFLENKEVFEFGHSLEEQIGGQIKTGFSIIGFVEDNCQDNDGYEKLINRFFSHFIMTYAQKANDHIT